MSILKKGKIFLLLLFLGLILLINFYNLKVNLSKKKNGLEINMEQNYSNSSKNTMVNQLKIQDVSNNSIFIKLISLEKLKKRIDNEETFWLYIGKNSCPDCREYYPNLVKYINNQEKDIFYFNTHVKISQKATMVQFLGEYKIYEIPTIVFFKNGILEESFNMQSKEEIEKFEEKFKVN